MTEAEVEVPGTVATTRRSKEGSSPQVWGAVQPCPHLDFGFLLFLLFLTPPPHSVMLCFSNPEKQYTPPSTIWGKQNHSARWRHRRWSRSCWWGAHRWSQCHLVSGLPSALGEAALGVFLQWVDCWPRKGSGVCSSSDQDLLPTPPSGWELLPGQPSWLLVARTPPQCLFQLSATAKTLFLTVPYILQFLSPALHSLPCVSSLDTWNCRTWWIMRLPFESPWKAVEASMLGSLGGSVLQWGLCTAVTGKPAVCQGPREGPR